MVGTRVVCMLVSLIAALEIRGVVTQFQAFHGMEGGLLCEGYSGY